MQPSEGALASSRIRPESGTAGGFDSPVQWAATDLLQGAAFVCLLGVGGGGRLREARLSHSSLLFLSLPPTQTCMQASIRPSQQQNYCTPCDTLAQLERADELEAS
jgi:hypothetical protein